MSTYIAIFVKRTIKEILLRFLNFSIVSLASTHVIWEYSIWALSHWWIRTIIEQFFFSSWELLIRLLNKRWIFATDPANFRGSIFISPSAWRLRDLISRGALLNISFIFIVIITWLRYCLLALRCFRVGLGAVLIWVVGWSLSELIWYSFCRFIVIRVHRWLFNLRWMVFLVELELVSAFKI